MGRSAQVSAKRLAMNENQEGLKEPSQKGKQLKKTERLRSPVEETEVEDGRLVSIEAEIKTKERTLALLSAKLPANDQLMSQLAERDKQISKLSNQILDLEGKLRSIELESALQKDKQIKQLKKERSDLTKQLSELEGKLLKTESETVDLKKALETEKEGLEMLNEALTEENEKLKAQERTKNEQMKSAKQDVLELSKIVNELSTLNTEFNEKVKNLNQEIEKKNADLFKSQTSAQILTEVEQELLISKAENQKLKRRAGKFLEMKASLVSLEDILKTTRESLKTIENQLGEIKQEQVSSVISGIQVLRDHLAKSTGTNRKVEEDPELFREEFRQMKTDLSEKTIELTKLTSIQDMAGKRIKELEQEKETAKSELLGINEKLRKRVKTLQEAMDKFKNKNQILEEEFSKLDGNYQKAQTQVVALQSQLQILKGKRSIETAMEEKLQSQIFELKSQCSQLKSQKSTSELSIVNREQVLKQHAIQLKTYTDALWKKDTELMKLQSQIEKMQEELSTRKTSSQEVQAMIKTQSAVDLTSASGLLQEKEREIVMLKDLLRGANQQLKGKEQELSRLRRKFESLSEPAPLIDVATSVFDLLKEFDEIQTGIERVQTDPKLPMKLLRKIMKTALIPEDKGDLLRVLQEKLTEVLGNIEKTGKQSPQTVITLKGNVLLNSTLLRQLAQESELTVKQIVGRLRST